MTKRKPPDQLMKEGRKSTYRKENVRLAQKLAHLGATDRDLADAFGVSIRTISIWQAKHPEFMQALRLGKKEADNRVTRSLFQKANGYIRRGQNIHAGRSKEADLRALRRARAAI